MGTSKMLSYTSNRTHMRHVRGYMWICLLVLVFGTMLLMDNGVSPSDLAHLPRAHRPKHQTKHQAKPPKKAKLPHAVLPSSFMATPPVLSHAPTVEQSIEVKEKPIISSTAANPASEHNFGNATNPLYASEILIVCKTGATALWKRIPMHLSTTLSRTELTPNIIFYSDAPDKVLGHTVHDCLANSSEALKASADFDLYRRIPQAREGNLYLEGAGMEGDFYIPGGWRLDKYKFVPLIAHAAKEYRNRNIKWFVYMEDDNYYFWNNLYKYLATFNPSTPFLIGSPAARLGEDFAHGGSGFAISAGAMEKTFWKDEDIPRKWEDYAKERCCGDQVLSHVMLEMGVPRYKGEEDGWFGLQSLPDYRIGFGDWNWCSPLMNVHKIHQADLSRLDGFEREFVRVNVSLINMLKADVMKILTFVRTAEYNTPLRPPFQLGNIPILKKYEKRMG